VVSSPNTGLQAGLALHPAKDHWAKDVQAMCRPTFIANRFSTAARAWIFPSVVAGFALLAISTATVLAQSSGAERDSEVVRRWRPALEKYVRRLEGNSYRGNFVIEGYLGQLDWLGDNFEEVPPGRFFGFSVRFSDRNDLSVEVITTRAVLINDSGQIVGDIEYPNSQLVWPGTRQPYLFGIPALRSTGWRSIAWGSRVWWENGW
jgi:hypothetical protein